MFSHDTDTDSKVFTMADPGPIVSKIYNQRGKGLTVVDKYGEGSMVANVAVECYRSIVSSENANFGYVWKVCQLRK